MLDTPFMDAVNRATYHELTPGGHKDPGHRALLARTRQSLRSATRYSIDDDTVRLVCHMTREIKRMELWSILARLPFDRVWIEFDCHTKVREFEKMGTLANPFNPDEVSQQVGYLIEKDLDSNTRWVAQEFINLRPFGSVVTQPNMIVFDPNGSPIQPCRGSVRWKQVTLSARPGMPKAPIQVLNEGRHLALKGHEMDVELGMMGLLEPQTLSDGTTIMTAPEWVSNKMAVIADPYYTQWVGNIKDGSVLNRTLYADALERTGMTKFLMTLLAMINDLPKATKHIARTGSQFTKQGPVKYLDHHTITITVPKGLQRRSISRLLDKAAVKASRAWHPVRGHWSVVEYGKQPAGLCKHEPTEVDGDYALCCKCERKIKWREFPHGRGDPRLGVITHDYHVTT
jgi:hypothetical protein